MARIAAGALAGLTFALTLLPAGLAAGQAAAQTFHERNQAVARCYRDAQRSVGSPPRDNPRPGDDFVAVERRRRDYDDRYRQNLDRCLTEADRQLRQKRP